MVWCAGSARFAQGAVRAGVSGCFVFVSVCECVRSVFVLGFQIRLPIMIPIPIYVGAFSSIAGATRCYASSSVVLMIRRVSCIYPRPVLRC